MLVLQRNKHEQIFIDVPPSDKPQRIAVMVCERIGDKVRLGFNAAREVRVIREELDDQRPRGEQS